MPTYTWFCGTCGSVSHHFSSISLRDVLPEEGCACGEREDLRRIIDMPAVMNAALPDGTRAKRDGTFVDMREVAKMEVQRASMPHDKRGDIDAEIKSRRKL